METNTKGEDHQEGTKEQPMWIRAAANAVMAQWIDRCLTFNVKNIREIIARHVPVSAPVGTKALATKWRERAKALRIEGDMTEVKSHFEAMAKLLEGCADELSAPVPERTNKDYAIEFGGYLAKAAESYLDARNKYDEKACTVGADTSDDDLLSDHFSALKSAIYEFRKRRDRALAAPVPERSDDKCICSCKRENHLFGRMCELCNCEKFTLDAPEPPAQTVSEPEPPIGPDSSWALAKAPLSPTPEPEDRVYEDLIRSVAASVPEPLVLATAPRFNCEKCGSSVAESYREQHICEPEPEPALTFEEALDNFPAEPPAQKDELGTCESNQWHQENEHIHVEEYCQNWKPVAPQASPEAPLILHKLRNPMDCTDDCPACAKEAPAKEDEQVGTMTLETVLKELDYCGIHFDAELAAEGAGWESAAEPEPQYFETLREAIGFQISLTDLIVPPAAGKEWLESQEFYELMQAYRISPLTKQRQVYASYEAVKSAIRARLGLSGRAE